MHVLNFLDFNKMKNSNLNYFQQLLFHTFPPPMNFMFMVLVLMPRILKADFRGDEVIEYRFFSCVPKVSTNHQNSVARWKIILTKKKEKNYALNIE